jgi:hypothetical protein
MYNHTQSLGSMLTTNTSRVSSNTYTIISYCGTLIHNYFFSNLNIATYTEHVKHKYEIIQTFRK